MLPGPGGRVDLTALMDRLGAEEIDSVLIEGGGELSWSLLSAGLVQRVQAYVAPKLFGGRDAPSPLGGRGVDLPAQAVRLAGCTVTRLGEDLLIEGEVEDRVHRDR